MDSSSFLLSPIDPGIADALRRDAGDSYVADETPGYPCRQCLRDAEVGEELVLVSYDPFVTETPYRSASPIFLHRRPCEPPADPGELPVQLTGRELSVRSFDRREMMIDAAVIDGRGLGSAIERFFANPASVRIHVHNANRGCWAVTVERA